MPKLEDFLCLPHVRIIEWSHPSVVGVVGTVQFVVPRAPVPISVVGYGHRGTSYAVRPDQLEILSDEEYSEAIKHDNKPPVDYVRRPDYWVPSVDPKSRKSLIAWLCWNDPNGMYTDWESRADGQRPLTLRQLLLFYLDQTSGRE